jgi:hypothetical protein
LTIPSLQTAKQPPSPSLPQGLRRENPFIDPERLPSSASCFNHFSALYYQREHLLPCDFPLRLVTVSARTDVRAKPFGRGKIAGIIGISGISEILRRLASGEMPKARISRTMNSPLKSFASG